MLDTNKIKITWYRLFVGTILLITICGRFYHLETKPFHHDESLYAFYSWKITEGFGYKYNPMMHGPFLFYLNAAVYSICGDSDYTARVAPALLGTLIVLFSLWLAPFIGRRGAIICATLFAISPTYMYFSRFLRMDIAAGLFTFCTVLSGLYFHKTKQIKYLYFLAASLSLLFCTKENSYVHTILFLGYFIIYFSYTRLFRDSAIKLLILLIILAGAAILFMYFLGTQNVLYLYYSLGSLGLAVVACALMYMAGKPPTGIDVAESSGIVNKSGSGLKQYGLALLIFWGIFFLFYTSFLQNLGGFLDGIYRKSIPYWMGQNQKQRIIGPFDYYVEFLILYELPLLIIIVPGLFRRLSQSVKTYIFLLVVTFFALISTFLWGDKELPKTLEFLHMTHGQHAMLGIYVLMIGLWGTIYFVRRDALLSFLVFWAMGAFLSYSYLGEKVPWLLVHIVLPQILIAGKLLGEFSGSPKFSRHRTVWIVLLCAGLLFYIKTTSILCFKYEANPRERMIYVQTSEEINKLLSVVHELAARMKVPWESLPTPGGDHDLKQVANFYDWDFPMHVSGEVNWPFQWYFRHFTNWGRSAFDNSNGVIIVDYSKREQYQQKLEADYTAIRVKIRSWWVPDRTNPTWNAMAWLKYFFFREVYSVLGSQDCVCYIRKDLLSGYNYDMEFKAVYGLGLTAPKIDPESDFVFGQNGTAQSEFNQPRGIAVDPDGAIYIVNTGNNRIEKFFKDGGYDSAFHQNTMNLALNQPTGIAVGPDRNIYVTDTWNHQIIVLKSNGEPVRKIKLDGEQAFWAPKGIFVDRDNVLYITDTGRHRIVKLSADGKLLQTWGVMGSDSSQLQEPVGISQNNNGELLVADTANHRICVYDTSGNLLFNWYISAWEDYYSEPFLAVDNENYIYYTDAAAGQIKMLTPEGKMHAWWNSSADKGIFNEPKGITFQNGNLYIVDMQNSRVLVISVNKIKQSLTNLKK